MSYKFTGNLGSFVSPATPCKNAGVLRYAQDDDVEQTTANWYSCLRWSAPSAPGRPQTGAIQSITYGISPATSVPSPTAPAATPDTGLANIQTGCPDPAYPTSVPATVFTPAQQTLSGLADGQYLLHYFAQDCAGTQELKFTQDTNLSWSTNCYGLTLTAAVQSSSAGAPNQLGSVSFYLKGTLLATAPVNASGVATTTVAAGTLPSGSDVLSAKYSGATNFAAGSASIRLTVP